MSWAPTLVSLVVLVVAAIVVVRRRTDMAILLLTPVVVATALATVHVAPLGAGRTDLTLYPALALVVGVAAAELRNAPLRDRCRGDDDRRNSSDESRGTRVPVGKHAQRGLAPRSQCSSHRRGARLLGRPLSLRALRPEVVARRANDRSNTAEGFEVRIGRSRLDILPDEINNKHRYAAVLARLTKNQDRVWFIGSHGRLDVVTIEKDLKALGYHSHRHPGDKFKAFVTLWDKG